VFQNLKKGIQKIQSQVLVSGRPVCVWEDLLNAPLLIENKMERNAYLPKGK
jgi:hypothetical protein